MSSNFTPPPTYASVVLYNENAADIRSLLRSVRFNPIWLKWFVDVAEFITAAGGGSGGGVAHNSTTGLQGGQATQYYHQTAAENTLYSGTKAANLVLAGPVSGVAAAPTFRSLVQADLPGAWTNYTPVVTLVGGAGNTVPVYSTNVGRTLQIGKMLFGKIYLTGDGGAEGAGTGAFTVSLAVAVGANAPASGTIFAGLAVNNATIYQLIMSLTPGATTAVISYWSAINAVSSFTGADQNNSTRTVVLDYHYEID